MEQFRFNQDNELAQRGWAHKFLFVGIVLGVVFVVSLGVYAYTSWLPANTNERPGAITGDDGYPSDTAKRDDGASTATTSSDAADEGTSDGGWFGWLFGENKKTNASVVNTSVGGKGERQMFNVLAELKPSKGATFDINSFYLRLPTNPVPGSRISSNKKVVSAPSEGMYEAQSAGSISFVPDSDFTGQTRGVEFEITDTKGVTFVQTYAPKVTEPVVTGTQPQPVVCSDPSSQGYRLLNKAINTERDNTLKYVSIIPNVHNGTAGSNYVYSQSSDNHIYRSFNNGQNWEYISPTNAAIAELPNVAADGKHLYVKIYEEGDSVGTFMYSSDKGDTWSAIESPVDGVNIRSLSLDGQVVIMGYYDFVTDGVYSYYSDNAGNTWSELVPPAGINGVAAFSVSGNGQILYASGNSGNSDTTVYYRSTDAGATWTDISFVPDDGYRVDPSNILSSFDGSVLVTGAYSSDADDYTSYKSNDGGASWTEVGRIPEGALSNIKFTGDGTALLASRFDYDAYEYHYYVSRNGGTTWQKVQLPGDEPYIFDMNITYDGTTILAVGSRVATTKDDGATWSYVKNNTQQPFDQTRVDLDPATPGQQLILDRSVTDGWIVRYDPVEDILSNEITDGSLFTEPQGYTMPYTLVPVAGCEGSTPGIITLRTPEL